MMEKETKALRRATPASSVMSSFNVGYSPRKTNSTTREYFNPSPPPVVILLSK